MIEADAAEGQGRRIQHPAALQGEIPLRVLGRIGHQPEMGQVIRQRLIHQSAIIPVNPGIAIDHQKGFWAQQGQCLHYAARGLEGALLRRPQDLDPELAAIAERLHQLVAEPGVVDHKLGHPGRLELLDVVDDEGLAPHRQQRLGQQVGERAHPLPTARGQDHRLHGCSPEACATLSRPGSTTCSSHRPKRASTGCSAPWVWQTSTT
ncbi:hypothetical protein D3C85_1096090 [compost metagenome]